MCHIISSCLLQGKHRSTAIAVMIDSTIDEAHIAKEDVLCHYRKLLDNAQAPTLVPLL